MPKLVSLPLIYIQKLPHCYLYAGQIVKKLFIGIQQTTRRIHDLQ
jgi:hypothetical protein